MRVSECQWNVRVDENMVSRTDPVRLIAQVSTGEVGKEMTGEYIGD